MVKLLFFYFRVTDSKLKKKRVSFWVTNSTGELFFWSWKRKIFTSSTNLENKTKSWFRIIVIRDFFYWNGILYNQELFKNNITMLNCAILDVDLAFNNDCLWTWDYTKYAMCCSILFYCVILVCFLKKTFVISLFS